MRLRYSPEARADISATMRYIADELCSPSAGERIVGSILECCSRLKAHPELGASLAARTGLDTDLRYIVCGRHLVFYRIEEDFVSIIRILDGRTDYLKHIFEELFPD